MRAQTKLGRNCCDQLCCTTN